MHYRILSYNGDLNLLGNILCGTTLEWPSWNKFKDGLKNFEGILSKYEIKTVEEFNKFQDKHPILDGIIKGGIPFLPPPINGVLQGIYDKAGEDKVKGAKDVFEYLKKLENQGETHYTEIKSELEKIELNMAKQETLVLIADILISTGDILKEKFEMLKKITLDVQEIKKDTTKIIGILSEESKEKIKEESLLETEDYLNADFSSQMKLFKKKVCEDYRNPPEKPKKPIIANFRKFYGAKYYVPQRYRKSKHEEGENVFKEILSLLNANIEKALHAKSIESDLIQKRKELEEIDLKLQIKSKLQYNLDIPERREIEREIHRSFDIPDNIIKKLDNERKLKNKLNQKSASNRIIRESKEIIEELLSKGKKLVSLKTEETQLLNIDLEKADENELLDRNKRLSEIGNEKEDLEYVVKNNENRISELKSQIAREEREINELETYEEELQKLKAEFDELDETTKSKIKDSFSQLRKISVTRRLYREISELVTKLSIVKKEKIIPIIGDYGSGKSALCHHVLNAICENFSEETHPIFIPLGQLPKNENSFESKVYEFIKSEYRFNLTKEEFEQKIVDGKFVFILDALDEMSTKLDSTIGQKNLELAIELSKKCAVVLTSRQTYFTKDMVEKLLFRYNDLIEITDFEIPEIEKFLKLHIPHDEKQIQQIKNVINDDRLSDFARKPLFLNIIVENFNHLAQYFPINESVILKILTDKWIHHDPKIVDATGNEQKKLIDSRERISEVLAFEEYNNNKPMGIDDIRNEVKTELQYDDPYVEDILDEYYRDAITSTFLVKEEDETYRFILKPVMEYFVARRIVNDLKIGKTESFKKHAKMIRTPETFDFIRGIIDIEWAVEPHVFDGLPKVETYSQFLTANDSDSKHLAKNLDKTMKRLSKFRNIRDSLFEIITEMKETEENIGNLIRILHITGNIPPRPNLSKINIDGAKLSGVDFVGANLDDSHMENVLLRGANLHDASLHNAILNKAILSGADLTNAEMSGAKLIGVILNNVQFGSAILDGADCTNADLSNVDLRTARIKKTRFRGTNFINSQIDGVDFSELDLTRAKLIGLDLTKVKLTNTVLNGTNFTDSNLSKQVLSNNQNLVGATFVRSDLTNADLHHADLHGADLQGAILKGTILERTDLTGVKHLPISIDEARERGAII